MKQRAIHKLAQARRSVVGRRCFRSKRSGGPRASNSNLGKGAFRVTAQRPHAARSGITLNNDPPCEMIRARRCARLCG